MKRHASPELRNLAGVTERKSFFFKKGRYVLCIVIRVACDDIGEHLGQNFGGEIVDEGWSSKGAQEGSFDVVNEGHSKGMLSSSGRGVYA